MRRRSRASSILVLASAVAVVAMVLPPAPARAATATVPGWSVRSASVGARTGFRTAIGPDGRHHFLGTDEDPVSGELNRRYRTDRSGTWVGMPVSSMGAVVRDFAVDANGGVHALVDNHYERMTPDGGWTVEDPQASVTTAEILIGPDGFPIIVGSGGFERRSSTGWVEPVGLGFGGAKWAIEPDGTLHAMGVDEGRILHATVVGTNVTTVEMPIENDVTCQFIRQVVVDAAGVAHALCAGPNEHPVSVVSYGPSGWEYDVVATGITPEGIALSATGVYVVGTRQADPSHTFGFDSSTDWSPELIAPLYVFGSHVVEVGQGPGGQISVFFGQRVPDPLDSQEDVVVATRSRYGTYASMPPTRLLDTRVGNGLSGRFKSGVPRTLQITGRAGIPSTAIAITGNLTVVGQSSAGFASVTSSPEPRPSTSTLNFPAGDTRANAVVAMVTAGKVYLTFRGASGSTTNLILDVTGYFVPGDGEARYVAITPTRLLDTRTGNGLSGAFISGTPRTVSIAGRAGIPADATAITGNLTVAGQTSGGYVAVTPAPTASPDVSTLNMPLGDTRANSVFVPLSAGKVSAVFKGAAGARTHLLFDVTGYFTDGPGGSRFVPMAPTRLVDTRTDVGLVDALKSGTPKSPKVLAIGGVPPDAVAIAGNATVVGQTSGGYLAVTKAATATPSTSTLNFPKGDVRANAFLSPVGGSTVGVVFKGASGATTQVLLDATGYFTPIP